MLLYCVVLYCFALLSHSCTCACIYIYLEDVMIACPDIHTCTCVYAHMQTVTQKVQNTIVRFVLVHIDIVPHNIRVYICIVTSTLHATAVCV